LAGNNSPLDDEKTIASQGIQNDDELTMDYKEITVQVEWNAQTESFKVDPDSKLSVLKDKINAKHSIVGTEYTLKKGAVILDETKTIAEQ
jgi:hypothetical protein